jgi:hypothetical protein
MSEFPANSELSTVSIFTATSVPLHKVEQTSPWAPTPRTLWAVSSLIYFFWSMQWVICKLIFVNYIIDHIMIEFGINYVVFIKIFTTGHRPPPRLKHKEKVFLLWQLVQWDRFQHLVIPSVCWSSNRNANWKIHFYAWWTRFKEGN